MTQQSWTVGTLSYNRKGLLKLFAWLLWGDFMIMLMMSVLPQLLPLSLKSLGATNATIGLLVGTIPVALNFVMNPFISTASDRHRGKMGRRIPFLLWPTPLITLFLILVGFSPHIGTYLHRTALGGWCEATTVIFILITVFSIAYQFFNLFVGSVYYYLLVDVVPSAMMGRFLSLMRLVSQLAGFFFGSYVFVYAENYMSTIFLCIGLLYLVAFGAMCLGVKEGNYPPPEKTVEKFNIFTWIAGYFRQCFSNPACVAVFFLTGLFNTWWCVQNLYNFIGLKTLNLSYQTVGNINGKAALVAIPAVLIGGWLVDKIGAFKFTVISAVLMIATAFAAFFMVNSELTLMVFTYLLWSVASFFMMAQIPMYITIFPKEQYGQFCSANAMVACLCMMINNYGIGKLVDIMQDNYIYLFLYLGICWALMAIPLLLIAKFKYHLQKTDIVPVITKIVPGNTIVT